MIIDERGAFVVNNMSSKCDCHVHVHIVHLKLLLADFLRCWALQTRKATGVKDNCFSRTQPMALHIFSDNWKTFIYCYFCFGGFGESLGSGEVALTRNPSLLGFIFLHFRCSCCKQDERQKKEIPPAPEQSGFYIQWFFLTWPEETITSSTTPHPIQRTHNTNAHKYKHTPTSSKHF